VQVKFFFGSHTVFYVTNLSRPPVPLNMPEAKFRVFWDVSVCHCVNSSPTFRGHCDPYIRPKLFTQQQNIIFPSQKTRVFGVTVVRSLSLTSQKTRVFGFTAVRSSSLTSQKTRVFGFTAVRSSSLTSQNTRVFGVTATRS